MIYYLSGGRNKSYLAAARRENQFMKKNTSVHPKYMALEDRSFVCLVFGLMNALLGPENVILTNRQNGF